MVCGGWYLVVRWESNFILFLLGVVLNIDDAHYSALMMVMNDNNKL